MKKFLKTIDIRDIVLRIKNNEFKPNLFLMTVVVTLCVGGYFYCSSDEVANIPEVFYKIMITLYFCGANLFVIYFDTLLMFMLTPKELTFKKANTIILYSMFISFVLNIIKTPFVIWLGEIADVLKNIITYFLMLYYVYQIKINYCPPKFKRIYVLFAYYILSLLNVILYSAN
ncbi:MAG: hypothetical protein IJM94_00515 [Clostridia bacterium]|nr:hypothetical protein [Clostridia bacterium]